MKLTTTIKNLKNYQYIESILPDELIVLIYYFIFGDDIYLLSNENDEINSFIFSKYSFTEGITYYMNYPSTDEFKPIFKNLLCGTAFSGNIERMLRLKYKYYPNIITEKDLSHSIDYALENGQINYIKYIMYMIKDGNAKLSINKWLKFCKQNRLI